jgi:AraC-like DNA-binding protein
LASVRTGALRLQAGLGQRFDRDVLQRAVAELHAQVFHAWLRTPLHGQKIAVEQHLREAACVLGNEAPFPSLARYIPDSAELPERRLFRADLSVILMLIMVERGDFSVASAPAVQRLAAALDMMKTFPKDARPTLREAAVALRVSPNYLGRLLHDHTGITFREYLLAARMFTAGSLLAARAMPLKEVAAFLGYGDRSSFFRYFRNVYGCGPTLYLLQLRSRGHHVDSPANP